MSDSLASACGWTLARTVVLCLVAWPLIVFVERWLCALADSRRPFALTLLLAPFLFPELLVGYVYRSAAMASTNQAEWLCAGLLFFRIVPVGVVTLLTTPATLVSETAIYCRRILWRANYGSFREWKQLALCYWHGPVRRTAPALCLMSLVAFQEFELAALLQTASWTDWFITAQRLGLDQGEMLRYSLLPMILQLPLLSIAICWFSRKKIPQYELREGISLPSARGTRHAVISYLGLALIFGCLIPMSVMAWNLPSGLMLFFRQPMQWMGLGRQIIITAAISICAGSAAWLAGGAWMVPMRRGINSAFINYGLLLPGLFGSLLLSLATVILFQQSWLRPLYDTPFPWMMALIAWLLPRAVVLRLWVSAITQAESVYLAELLIDRHSMSSSASAAMHAVDAPSVQFSCPNFAASSLLFRLRDQPRLLAIGLLCYWAYLDLSTAYMLAPSEMSSGIVHLYNFMHFGRSAALSAEAFVFFGTPVVVTLLMLQSFQMIVWRRSVRIARPRP